MYQNGSTVIATSTTIVSQRSVPQTFSSVLSRRRRGLTGSAGGSRAAVAGSSAVLTVRPREACSSRLPRSARAVLRRYTTISTMSTAASTTAWAAASADVLARGEELVHPDADHLGARAAAGEQVDVVELVEREDEPQHREHARSPASAAAA